MSIIYELRKSSILITIVIVCCIKFLKVYEIPDFEPERIGESDQVLQSDVLLPALYHAYISAVGLGYLAERLLREAFAFPFFAYLLAYEYLELS